jgi:hypothetical protein
MRARHGRRGCDAALRAGLPAPAFNPYCRDKTFYKFLFAGVLMLLGCMMPFSADYQQRRLQDDERRLLPADRAWRWSGRGGARSPTTARPGRPEVAPVRVVPLVAGIMSLVGFDPEGAGAGDRAAARLAARRREGRSPGRNLFGDIGSALAKSSEAALRVENFWRLFGTASCSCSSARLIARSASSAASSAAPSRTSSRPEAKMMAAAERKRR